MSEQLKHIPGDIGLRQPIIDAPELHVVEQGEQTAEEKELTGRISQIRGLPHENLLGSGVHLAWFKSQQARRFTVDLLSFGKSGSCLSVAWTGRNQNKEALFSEEEMERLKTLFPPKQG